MGGDRGGPWAQPRGGEGRPRWAALAAREQRLRARRARRAARRRHGAGASTASSSPRGDVDLDAAPSRAAARGSAGRRSGGAASTSPRPRIALAATRLRAVGARRDAATGDDHEDVVIQRRSFRAMGTDVELFLAAEPGPGGRRGARRGRARVRAGRGAALALPPRLGALGAEPRRPHRRGRRTCSPWSSSRSTRGSGRAAGSTRPSTTRSSRPATTARSTRSPPTDLRGRRRAAAAVRVRDRRAARSSSRPGVHLDLGGIGKGYTVDRAAAILSAAGPCARRRGRRHRARGRPDALGWRVGVETTDGHAHARARGRRDRDLRPRPTPLAARRRGAPPPDRPARPDGRPTRDLAPRDRRRADGRRGGGAREVALPRGRAARPRGRRRVPACSSRPTAAP